MFWPEPETGPWIVVLTWELTEGRYECVGVEIRSYVPDEGPMTVQDVDALAWPGGEVRPVTAVMLRTLPIGSLIEDERSRMAEWYRALEEATGQTGFPAVNPYAAGRPDAVLDTPATREQWRRPGRPPRHDPAEVAAIYTQAWRVEGSRAPTKAVAEALRISPSAAAKQVARARSLGLLPPTQRGQAKGRETTDTDTTTEEGQDS